jgi:hypothetical protein
MQLVGMLDSPCVRRAAISLRLLGVPFAHHSRRPAGQSAMSAPRSVSRLRSTERWQCASSLQ